MVKAWSTDLGLEAGSTNIQVHGGMGFIEETGAAQHLRDARIALIYEGTNGIQANDLVGRKLVRDDGRGVGELVADMRAAAASLGRAAGAEAAALHPPLVAAIAALETASAELRAAFARDPARALAGAVPYLRLMGLVAGGWLMAKALLAAQRRAAARRRRRVLPTPSSRPRGSSPSTCWRRRRRCSPAIAGGATVMASTRHGL